MQEYIKNLGSGNNHLSFITLIISNDEIKDIIKIVKSLEDSGLLLKEVSETVQNEAREQTGEFLSMLLGTLGASLLGNILEGREINRTGEGVVRASYGHRSSKNKKNGSLMLSHPLTNFEL